MFVKLFSRILDSSIADDRALRHFFTDMLLCSDAKGFVMMTPQAIARRIGATAEEVLDGIAKLEAPDSMSKTPDHEGRRIERVEGSGYGWRILNYELYRSIRDEDQMRQATCERVRKCRDRKRNGVVTPCNDKEEGDIETKGKEAIEGVISELQLEVEPKKTLTQQQLITQHLPPQYEEDEVFMEALTDYIAVRKAKKAPVTEAIGKRLARDLGSWGRSAATQALEASIRANWTDVYPPKNGQRQNFAPVTGKREPKPLPYKTRAQADELNSR